MDASLRATFAGMKGTWTVLLATCIAACHPPSSSVNTPTPLVLELPTWAARDTALRVELPYDNPLTVEGVALGRRLFHEPALSADGSLSCASCHQQHLAFSDGLPVARGVNGNAGMRNTPTIQNVAWDHFFFWDARALSIELQAFAPVTGHAEMGSRWADVSERLRRDATYPPLFRAAFGDTRIDSLRVAFALAQFERTLVSLNARFDRYFHRIDGTTLTPSELRGKDLFFTRANCADCHTPPLFGGHEVQNIGLDSVPVDPGMGGRTHVAWHMGRFKTPSLRNVAVTAPYMHDGRFATLEQVVDFYADDVNVDAATLDVHMQPWVRGEVRLSQQDRADLVAFLKTLTDEGFLVNPAFGKPE